MITAYYFRRYAVFICSFILFHTISLAQSGNVGIGTTTPTARLHVKDSNVLFTGEYPVPYATTYSPPAQGTGTRMMWYPQKAAFRAGAVSGPQWDKDSIGRLSFAAGYNTTASADATTAMGTYTTASGHYSTAMGLYTTASGWSSNAMGYLTIASGSPSIAMGVGTKSKSFGGTVIGIFNDSTNAANPTGLDPANRIFQIGNGTADDARSNAMTVLNNGNTGIGTTIPVARLHVKDSNVLFTGEFPVPATTSYNPPAQGAGTRMMWYPQKAAFRAGEVSGTHWDKDNIGIYSFASGYDTKASGGVSSAMGGYTTASGNYSTAIGFLTTASGNFSTAMGASTTASGVYSTAMGWYSTASGYRSTAIGSGTTASGDYSTAMGYGTTTSNYSSTAMGYGTTASGYSSTAMGDNTTASGNYSTAMGRNSTASGYASTAMGLITKSKSFGGVVVGIYNDSTNAANSFNIDPANRIFQIGNGTGDNVRSNAMTVLQNGNVGIGTTTPGFPLNFTNDAGDKISLWGNSGAHYGFGIQSNLMQLYTDAAVSDIAFGYGSSSSFTERARIINNGEYGMSLTGRMRLRTGTQSAGIWLFNAANTNGHAFIGMKTDTEVGFFGQTGTPGWRFYVNTTTGDGWMQGTLTQNSDATLKKNLRPLTHTLNNLQQLYGYTYNWNDNSNPDEQIGLLAQEIQKVYPQLVKEHNGKLSVNYNGMVPVLVEAIKEQQQQIGSQQNQIITQQQQIDELKRMVIQIQQKDQKQ